MKSNRYLFSTKVYQLSALIHYTYRYVGNVSHADWKINDVCGSIGQFISRWNVHHEFVHCTRWFIVVVRTRSNVAFYTNYSYIHNVYRFVRRVLLVRVLRLYYARF